MREQTDFDRIPNVAAEIHIKMDRAGKVYVSAPHGNRGVCYMLLELARDQIDKECDRDGLLTVFSRRSTRPVRCFNTYTTAKSVINPQALSSSRLDSSRWATSCEITLGAASRTS
jgi:hypothetical protein